LTSPSYSLSSPSVSANPRAFRFTSKFAGIALPHDFDLLTFYDQTMKTKAIITASILALATLVTFGQAKEHKDHVWQYSGKNRTHTLGLYGALNGSYSPVMDENAGWFGARIGVVFDHRLGVGIAGYGLSYDRTLSDIVEDGSYHLEAGYSGLFVEYLQPIGNNVKVNFSALFGSGIAQYRYDKDFREGKPWYDEIIDRADFHLFEPGIEWQFRMAGNWWIGAYGTYRFSSPIDLQGADEDLFQNFTAGVSLKYGIF